MIPVEDYVGVSVCTHSSYVYEMNPRQLFTKYGFTLKFLATFTRGYLILIRGKGDPGWRWCVAVEFDHLRGVVSDLSIHTIKRIDQKWHTVFTEGECVVLRGESPESSVGFDTAIEDPCKLCDPDVLELIRECRNAIRRRL